MESVEPAQLGLLTLQQLKPARSFVPVTAIFQERSVSAIKVTITSQEYAKLVLQEHNTMPSLDFALQHAAQTKSGLMEPVIALPAILKSMECANKLLLAAEQTSIFPAEFVNACQTY